MTRAPARPVDHRVGDDLTGSVKRIPVACTLTAADASDRLEEWRSFFAAHGGGVEMRGATAAAVRLRDGDEALLAAADLASREKLCCGFFSFSIAIRPDGRWLEVSVDDEQSAVLRDLMALAPRR